MTPKGPNPSNSWDAEDYAGTGAFVPALGEAILGQLAAKPGERILDVGCGDGVLTARIAETGAAVVGVDASMVLLEAAMARGVDARLGDAAELDFQSEFDAVFSNAALHWVLAPRAAAAGMFRALRPGGRFVVEFGGFGNIAAILTALRAVLAARGFHELPPDQYYPTAQEYAQLLAEVGFEGIQTEIVPRPTPLATGMDAWIRTFRTGWLEALGLSAEEQASVRSEAVALLAPSLCTAAGEWVADYVRIRARAVRPAG